MIEIVNDLDLIDIYRYLHPHEKRFLWRKKTPLKQARLDYFLLSSAMVDIINKCNINPSYQSDHSIIELQICLNNFTQEKSFFEKNSITVY